MTYTQKTYNHLKDEFVRDSRTDFLFQQLIHQLEQYPTLNISDDDFKRLFTLQKCNISIEWFVHRMGRYNTPLADVLIAYITYRN